MSNVLATNKTLSSITVSAWTVYYINSSNAELVTVYDSSDNSYDCFKYLLNNISYYYVLDSVQNAWVNDLSGIGYSLTPPVVLPTVTEIWTLPNDSSGISTIQSGSANTLWKNTPSWAQIPYDVTSCYAVAFWRKANNTLGGRTEFSTENISDLLAARNVSSNAIEVYWIKVAVCSSNQASVVTVYDSGDTAYNAFKYTIDNIDYYYVLDGTQTDWTDDLISIGYSLTPSVVLPTVSVSPWVYFTYRMQDQYYQFNSGSEQNIYTSATAQNSTIQYDSSSIYAVQDAWYKSYAVARTQLQCFNNSGVLAVRNVSSESFRSSGCYYCTCSDSTATVITVYDSSNVAYNTFLYTASGTNYYYVLDGVQADWTDNLASIGYQLPETGWFNSSKTDVSINYGGWKHIVDTNGNRITYDSTKVYTLVALYNKNNASVTFTSGISIVNQLSSIALVNYEASIGNINVAKVYYIVS